MSAAPFRLRAQALDESSFAPFGEIIGPRNRPAVTNRDLLARGLVRIEHPVPEDRIADFDVLDYWAPVAEISADTMKLGFLRPRMRALEVGWFERHLRGTQSFLPLGGARSLFVLVPPNDPFDKRVSLRTFYQQKQPRIGTKLTSTHQATRNILFN